MSVELERLLSKRLTQAYGPGSVPGHLYEIGANLPHPGLSWRAGSIVIFLHRNRNYVAPVGVREGLQLIAVRQEVLDQRDSEHRLAEAFGSTTKFAYTSITKDLSQALGSSYPAPCKRPASEAERAKAERDTQKALLSLLRQTEQGDRSHRAAVLVAADDLAVRLGGLLVARSVINGSEALTEASESVGVRRQLASYNVRYAGIDHDAGDLLYDRSLLRRAWKEAPETTWGQRAFLMLQGLSCSDPKACKGPECFRAVIQQGENFLHKYPETPFRTEQIYYLALAYETWWSVGQAQAGDPTAAGAKVDKPSAERARIKAMELYNQLLRSAPESPEAQAGRLKLPRLKLKLGTGERTFFCSTC